MHKFTYTGAVMIFGKYAGHVLLETRAETEAKARGNFKYQVRRKANVMPNAPVQLLGEIKLIY